MRSSDFHYSQIQFVFFPPQYPTLHESLLIICKTHQSKSTIEWVEVNILAKTFGMVADNISKRKRVIYTVYL